MSREDRETKIYDFIVSRFRESDLERYNMMRREEYKEFGFGFGTIENFRTKQRAFLKNSDDDTIEHLRIMKLLIEKGTMSMDKERMVPFRTSGFCFDTEGKIVIFNER